MSTTNTNVSVPEMPARAFPFVPYPLSGGITRSTRLPIFWPTSVSSQPLITLSTPIGNEATAPRSHEASNCLPVAHTTPTYWATSVLPFTTAGPSPCTSVLATSALGAPDEGISIVGFLPASAVTLGSMASARGTDVPVADDVALNEPSTSTTNTSVAFGGMSAPAPWAP